MKKTNLIFLLLLWFVHVASAEQVEQTVALRVATTFANSLQKLKSAPQLTLAYQAEAPADAQLRSTDYPLYYIIAVPLKSQNVL